MNRAIWVQPWMVAWSLTMLFSALFGSVPLLCAGGAVHYQAGDLSGYPDAPAQPAPERGMWQDSDGVHYRSTPPKDSWQTPWLEEQKREERSWNMLNNMILDVSPYRKRPKQALPQRSTQSK